jgi:Trm5-related predicted tRNA methylase
VGECSNYGVETLKFCPSKLISKRLVTWHKISYITVGKTNEVQNKKVSRVEYCETKPRKVIEYLKPKLKNFVVHNFMSKWQKKEIKKYLPNLPPNTMVYCINFSENYVFKVQNEIQDMH